MHATDDNVTRSTTEIKRGVNLKRKMIREVSEVLRHNKAKEDRFKLTEANGGRVLNP